MRAGTRVRLLRILATVAVNACIYASAFTLRATLFGTDGGFVSLALFASAMLLSHAAVAIFLRKTPGFIKVLANSKPAKFFAFMLKINDAAEFVSLTIAWLIILFPMLFTFFTYGRVSIPRVLFELVSVILTYAICLKHARFMASKIMNKAAVYAGFGILAVCLELPLIFAELLYLRPRLFAITLFFIFAYLIVKNQEDIERNIFNKRHIEKSILPKNLRSFNALTVSIIFIIVLFLFNLKEIVIAIINLLTDFLAIIAVLLMMLVEWIAPKQEHMMQGGMPGESVLPDLATQPASPLANFIFNVLGHFVVLYLAYRLLLFVLRRLPAFCRRIAQLLKKLFSTQKEQAPIEESDFVDETETVRPVREGSRGGGMRKIRKGRSDLRRVKDPMLRVRMMYSIILGTLSGIGVNPDKSDTTMEIIEKIPSDDVLQELYPFTQMYNQVRYRELMPDDKMLADAQERFNKTVELIGR